MMKQYTHDLLINIFLILLPDTSLRYKFIGWNLYPVCPVQPSLSTTQD